MRRVGRLATGSGGSGYCVNAHRTSTAPRRLVRPEVVGGVLAVNVADLMRANGFSNLFWGWGGEDDDFGLRLQAQNISILRPNRVSGRRPQSE